MTSQSALRLTSLAALSLLGAAATVVVLVTAPARTDNRQAPGVRPDGGALVSTNQVVTPAGTVHRLDGARAKDLAVSTDGKTVAVLAQGRVALFRPDGTPVATVPISGAVGPLGLAWAPDGASLYASGDKGRILRLAREKDSWKVAGGFSFMAADADSRRADDAPAATVSGLPAAQDAEGRIPGDPQVTGLAVAPDSRRLYVALGIRNAVAVLDLPAGTLAATIPVGVAPYRLLLAPDGKTLYVANRGGRAAAAGEISEPSAGTPVRVDARTDAALDGSLSVIDTERLALAAEIAPAGRQPSGMTLSPDGRTLYVASSDDDTVLAVDTRTRRVAATVNVRPAEDPGFGQMPTDVAVSSDGKALYVACGGGNAVAVLRLTPGSPAAAPIRVTGYLPAGWFPIALAARDGRLFVASSKGLGSRAPARAGGYSVAGSVGVVQIVPENGIAAGLPKSTRQVAANNHWGEIERPARAGQAPRPVPERVGEPSVFRHVVYIIKENHTYDLDLGDMPEGNGDKSLCLFGEDVTPNEHALAREFVLLDNTYTSGTNSADGHQWTDSAVANAYMEQNYDAHARSYPFNGRDPLAYSPQGFLWNAAAKQGKSVRIYGEFVNKPSIVDPATRKRPTWTQFWQAYRSGKNPYRVTARTDNLAVRPFLCPDYVGFPQIVCDQYRADRYLAELKRFEAEGEMPALSILSLPNNHTSGTEAGMPTPRAEVADNDLALGRIVEGITHSRFWKDTLILVVEDDSQFGLDHVDGHRTVAFCISPYTRRGAAVHDFYTHTSFVRTIGLVLGLPPMTRFDRTAAPLTACFTDKPDLRPYDHRANRTPLDEMNPAPTALRGERRNFALASARLNWSEPDLADATVLARAVWSIERPGMPFPWAKFHPNKDVDDDDD